MKLFCVLVSSGHGYWDTRNPSVHASDGYEIWEAENQDALDEDIWEARSEAASGYSVDGNGMFYCSCCGIELSEDEECETCEVEAEEGEEEWCDHVEKNSYSIVIPYDPTNHEHALCKDRWSVSTPRPEHEIALEVKRLQDKANRQERIENELVKAQEALKIAQDNVQALILKQIAEALND